MTFEEFQTRFIEGRLFFMSVEDQRQMYDELSAEFSNPKLDELVEEYFEDFLTNQ